MQPARAIPVFGGSRAPNPAVPLVGGSVAFIAFIADSGAVARHLTGQWDREVELRVHATFPHSLLGVMQLASAVGRPATMLAIALIAAIVAFRRGAIWVAVPIVVGVGGSELLETMLKVLFRRSRPSLWAGHVTASGYSYPSGHATAAAACATALILALWYTWRSGWTALISLVCIAGALLIGFSRIALGAHWPTDVIGGWCLGVFWVSLMVIAGLRVRAHGPLSSRGNGAGPVH